MDCNRDEALRAKEIAEKKFNAKDTAGAKKFALKAQNLFPELEGINQMITTLDVYLAAEVKLNGESDWYSILCVNASADEEAVKKQYRKLALQLHPDKNKSIGAEGAFKLVSEAWSVLSDKTQKMVYDQKRNVKGFQKRVSRSKRDHSGSHTANGFYNFTNNTAANFRMQKSTTGVAPSATPPNLDTFWTSCSRCRMQYEYLRIYLNHNLLCPNCHEAFFAVETGVPSNVTSASTNWSAPQQRRQNSTNNSTVKMGATGFSCGTNLDAYNTPNFQWDPFSRMTGAASATASSSHADNVVHQAYERARRERKEAQAATKWEEAFQRKNYASKRAANGSGNSNVFPKVDRHDKRRRSSISDDTGTAYRRDETDQTVQGMGKPDMDAFGTERANGAFRDPSKARLNGRLNSLSREFAQLNIRNLLMERSKMKIQKKLEEWNLAAAAKLAAKEKVKHKPEHKENESNKVIAAIDEDAIGHNRSDDARSSSRKVPGKSSSSHDHNSDSDREPAEPVSINVPDPDFHDFDKDRSERSCECDQVWATYDNKDGMPRFYVLIQKVLSYKPFKIRMSFLNSRSNSELGPLNWVGSGFSKTCGDFRVGRCEISDTVNIFSHKVKWEKRPRGVIRVVPRKGDIWALYKNWSPEWNEHTTDDVIYKYDMVEVLDDYDQEQGVFVTPLVKVAGFKTVFHRHLDPNEIRRIPREEMFCFSHQVPSYLLTGEEAHNAPEGCCELDPAATPVELLQIMTEVKEDEVMETAEGHSVG